MLNFTGAGPGFLKNSILFHQEHYLQVFNLHLDLMQQHLDRYTGIHLKDGIPKPENQTAAGILRNLRTIQDFYVKYGLSTAEGVSEVASVGGFVKEYQVDLNPDALKAYNVSVMDVMNAVKKSNLDIGAETIELNNVEYIIRGLGYVKNLNDLEISVVAVRNNVPVRIKDVAHVAFGPATRRGGLDKAGSEAVVLLLLHDMVQIRWK